MNFSKVVLFFVGILVCVNGGIFERLDPDLFAKTDKMATDHHYPVESHNVTTSDGYILEIFRIPGHQWESLEEAKSKKRPPLMLQHGIFQSSDAWLDDSDEAPGYFFAEQGYDVWLTNNRGNRYGRRHVSLKPTFYNEKFWNFTFEEMGLIDAIDCMDYILNQTGYDKLAYVGYSQGTSQMFAALALIPEQIEKRVYAYAAFAPVARLDDQNFIFRILGMFRLDLVFEWLSIYELFPEQKWLSWAFSKLCTYVPGACDFAFSLIVDNQPYYDNQDALPSLASHCPEGTSLKELKHYLQIIENGQFARYQPSVHDKLVLYDFQNAPDVPVGLFGGAADKLASKVNVNWLVEEFTKRGTLKFHREYAHMGHVTFMIPKVTFEYLQDAATFLEEYYLDKL